MRLRVLVVTADRNISNIVGRKGGKLISESFHNKARKAGLTIVTSSFFMSHPSADDVSGYFIEHADDIDAGVVILDKTLSTICGHIAPSLFVTTFSAETRNPNYQNILRGAYANALKAFIPIFERFQKAQNQKALMLPIRNFIAQEVDSFFASVASGSLSPRVIDEVDLYLSKIRARQQPKTATKDKSAYHVDDEHRFFQLGHERHAQPETARPPHLSSCVLSSKFRLGNRLGSVDV